MQIFHAQAHAGPSLEGIIDSLLVGTSPSPGLANKQPPRRSPSGPVLSSDVLNEVALDNERLELPAWIKRSPRRPGEASSGKMSADEWRTFCTVNLIVTLGRLWGHQDATSENLRMLHHFFYLVMLVQLGTRHTSSPSRISRYSRYVGRYFQDFHVLYPSAAMTPNFHALFHFGDVLDRWGPSPHWWTFPYERYNGMMQDISTNSKIGICSGLLLLRPSRGLQLVLGELETTIFDRFQNISLLKAFCKTATVDPILQPLLGLVDGQLDNNYSGTLMTDLDAAPTWRISYQNQSVELSKDVFILLKQSVDAHLVPPLRRPTRVTPCSLSHRSVRYCRHSEHGGNSHILYLHHGTSYVGQISFIFQAELGSPNPLNDIFICVRRYLPLSEDNANLDPYLAFEDLGARVCYAHFEKGFDLIRPRDIQSHVAACPFEVCGRTDLKVFVSLDRVSPATDIYCACFADQK